MMKDGMLVEIQSVGAGAVNQAVKAIAISRGFLSPIGIEIVCVPSFADIVIDGEYRTAFAFPLNHDLVTVRLKPQTLMHKINLSKDSYDHLS